jgi:hypothetical protein
LYGQIDKALKLVLLLQYYPYKYELFVSGINVELTASSTISFNFKEDLSFVSIVLNYFSPFLKYNQL